VVQLVSALREIDLSDKPTIARRLWVRVDDTECVGLTVVAAGEQSDVREPLRGCLGGECGRRIETWIGKKAGHLSTWLLLPGNA
jgi:hypothetical protein